MAKSLNKIYKEQVNSDKISFADWLHHEKYLYAKKEHKMEFPQWVNLKYSRYADKYLSFDWDSVKDWVENNKNTLGDIASGIAQGGSNGATEGQNSETPENKTEPKQNFLGINPIITWSVAGLLLAGVTYGVIKIIKNHKK